MKELIKKLAYRNYYIYQFSMSIYKLLRKIKGMNSLSGCNIVNKGVAKIKKDIIGSNNIISIGSKAVLHNTHIRIRGNNNKISFEEGCMVGPLCSFWMEGNNIQIQIGRKTTFTHSVHFCIQEDNMCAIVGEGCMFSNHITVRTSDGHPIYKLNGNTRINKPKSVYIGKNVWIAPDTKIMKGSYIGDGSIIGSDSMVNGEIPANVLAAGHPAKVIKVDIKWTREQIIPN